jgi:methionine synthase / methylenetetrahydrofolate reductase(NADPH)
MTQPTLRNARELLDPDRVVVFDGATGTMLYAKGVFINQCYDQLNVTQPDLVRDVHSCVTCTGRISMRAPRSWRRTASAPTG